MAKEEEGKPIFGDFWLCTEKRITIHHAGLIDTLVKAGFCWLDEANPRLIRIVDNRIKSSNVNQVIAYLKKYIDDLNEDEFLVQFGHKRKDLVNAFARGINTYINSAKLMLLPIMQDVKFHRDSKDKCYFYFKNGVVEVSANERNLLHYKDLNGHLWEKQVREKSFTLLPPDSRPGQFEIFARRACGENEEKFRSLQTIYGSRLHRYFVASKSLIPCILDETITGLNDENQGGTGKTLLVLGMEFVRNVVIIDGKTFNPESQFAYQRVDHDTDIIFIDDLNRHTSLESFFSLVTTGFTVQQKRIPEFMIHRDEAPKIIITSNFSIKAPVGNSTDRRKIDFEVGQYYNANKTVRDDFKCEFFTDWDEAEFNKMFNFFVGCVQLYLQHGIIIPPSVNTELREIIRIIGGPDLKDFLDDKIAAGTEKYLKHDFYTEFTKTNPGLQKYYNSSNTFFNKVHKYLKYRGIEYRETPANAKKFIEFIVPDKILAELHASKEEPPLAGFTTIHDVHHNYIIVDTKEKRAELITTLQSSERFAFDTETAQGNWGDALTIHSLDLVCITFCTNPGTAYLVPIPKDDIEAQQIVQEFNPVFQNETIEKIAHNAKFDMNVLRRYGLIIRGRLFDTLVSHYLCNPESSHGLKDVALELLQFQQTQIEELIGSGKHQLSMRDVPLHQLVEYACQDADITFQLMLKLQVMLKERGAEKLFAEMESKLIYVLADMEYNGVRVDYDVLGGLADEAGPLMEKLEKEIYLLAGKEFKINSLQQLSKLLFEDLGMTPVGTTEKGAPSTGKKDLAKLKNGNSIIPLIQEYKQTSSIKSTFLTGLPDKISPVTGRVHGHFNQAVAATGRLSSSQPNLQNIPKNTPSVIGKAVRKAFVPSDINHNLSLKSTH